MKTTRFLKFFDGRAGVSNLQQGKREIVVGFGVGRRECDNFLEGVRGAFWVSSPLEQQAEARLQRSGIGLKFGGMFVGSQRFVAIALRLEQGAAVVPSGCVLGIEL